MEQQATHTPGPWGHEKRSATDAILSADGGIIGEVYGRSSGKGGLCTANARLVAAAPDLLAACSAMLGAMRLGYITSGVPASAPYAIAGPDYFNEHLHRLTAAITKAEGRPL